MDCDLIVASVQSHIGTGEGGAVYKVVLDHQEYAVKEQPFRSTDHIYGEAFREAVILSSISHPYIIGLHHTCLKDDRLKLVLELGAGNLGDWLNNVMDPPSPEEKKVVGEYIECAVDFLHKLGVYHNDLHLQNVVLVEGIPKLIDFGYSSPIEGRFADNMWQAELELVETSLTDHYPEGHFYSRPQLRTDITPPLIFETLKDESVIAGQMYDGAMRLVGKLDLDIDDDLLFRACLYCWALLLNMGDYEGLTTEVFLTDSEYTGSNLLDTVELICITLNFQLL
jgi:serine/threonine protein kinase